ncbi:MAG: thiamine-phosphate kinase [Thermodesulfovibrionales bacterium]|nr:thiamine-phosphate kinase [Thermodesulfovibrionales bacterium]
MKTKRLIRQVGEDNLLKEVQKRFQVKSNDVIQSIGDDCAVLSIKGKNILITTDMMNEGIHFNPSYTSGYSLGFKLISVNVSDIYATGGIPTAAFLNVGLPPSTKEAFFWDFYDGIADATRLYNLKLLGGDLCAVKKHTTVSATIIGKAQRHVLRSGANVGDLVCLSGSLGDSALGLKILSCMKQSLCRMIKKCRNISIINDKVVELTVGKTTVSISFNEIAPFVSHHLMPIVKRLEVVERFATSCIDTSDGLSKDLNRICDNSGVGALIELNKIPVSKNLQSLCQILGLNAKELILNGGEDYRLLFTLPRSAVANNNNKYKPDKDFYIIGEITDSNRCYLDEDGKIHPLLPKGFEHFD